MAINTTTSVDVQTLTPFKKFIMTIGALPTSYLESMSYAELLMWFCNYLQNTVIPTVNNNGEAVEELQNLYDELRTYVNTYFDNLDVQEEVNNKLDAMVEDGTLGNIINQEIFGELNNEVNGLINEKPDYKPLTMIQDLALSFPADTSLQSFCVDDNNNIYIYKIGTAPNGDLYKYSMTSHTLISTTQNLKLYHGNSMAYINGKIYVASFNDASNNPNKVIAIYDTNNGTVSEINPFSTLSGYYNIVALCRIDDNNLMVAITNTSNNILTDRIHYFKLNLTNLNYYEVTTIYYMEIGPAQLIDITFINGKFYVITNDNHYLMEFDYNSTDEILTQRKTYIIPKKNDLNIDLGEIEGISYLPSGLYGNYTFVFTAFQKSNTSHGKSNYFVYYSNLVTDICEINGPVISTNVLNNGFNIYVDSSATTLLENGTNDYPFKDLNTAIAFANSGKYNINNIYIKNSATYDIGSHWNENFVIRPVNGTINVTILFNELHKCNVSIIGSNVTLGKNSNSLTQVVFDSCTVYLYQCNITTSCYVQSGSVLHFNYVNYTIDYDVANIMFVYNSTANLYVHNIGGTGTVTRFLNLQQGSRCLLDHAHASVQYAVLSGSSLTIADV